VAYVKFVCSLIIMDWLQLIEVVSHGLQRQQMENNEGGESSNKLSPPRILPLTSLRISEGKGHLQLVIGSFSGHFPDSQQGLLAQDQNY
jgi:hypothetical protein